MADKMTIMKKWFEDITNDPNFETTEQELAYIMYATLKYGLYGEKSDLGEVFGSEFRGLNRSMSNIYGQIDNIQSYDPTKGKQQQKYDDEAIKECRLQGMTGKEICIKLGYPLEKERSLSSNPGWKEAKRILDARKAGSKGASIQKTVKTVKADENLKENNIKNTENTENCTVFTENTDSVNSVKSGWSTDSAQKKVDKAFNF